MRRYGVWVLVGVALAVGPMQARAQDNFPRINPPTLQTRPAPAVPRAPAQTDPRPAEPIKSAEPKSTPASTKTESAKTERERDVVRATEPMKLTRVRAAATSCGDTCPEWIAAEGRIMSGSTANQLRRFLAGLGDKKIPVFIHSAGGSVEEAYAMGRLIRGRGLPVSVTKTEFVECATDDKACRTLGAKGIKLGNPKPPLSVCASSCVFILAAGAERHVGPTSLVGVHQYESSVTHVQVLQKYRMVPDARGGLKKQIVSEERVGSKTVKTRTKSEVYDKSAAYFAEMGVSSAIMEPLLATPHSSMHWLTPSEINASRIATDRKSGLQVTGLAPADVERRRILEAAEARARDAAMARQTAGVQQKANECDGPALACATGMAGAVPNAAAVKTTSLTPAPSPPYEPMVARTIQQWLVTSNCQVGPPTDQWGDPQKKALAKLASLTRRTFSGVQPSFELLAGVRSAVTASSENGRVCEAPAQ